MYSAATYTGNGAQVDFAVPFPYILRSHVEVSVNGLTASYVWVNPGLIQLKMSPPAVGVPVVVRRNSNRTARLVDFQDSSALEAATLDLDSNQLMYLIQEALDQASTQSYFSTDAGGARVINVADPINPSDAATRGWVIGYVTSLTIDGNNLLPLNNTWTGTNAYTKAVTMGSAVWDPITHVGKDLLGLSKGIYVQNNTDNATQIGYGYATQVRRSAGYGLIVGGQFVAMTLGGHTSLTFGGAYEAWKGKDALGGSIGIEAAVVQLNPNDFTYPRIGLDVVFKNREDAAVQGGNAINVLGLAGYGTGTNYYNANSWAIQISSQNRSDSNATFVGWNRGIRLRHYALDTALVPPFDVAKAYDPGDYTFYAGRIYVAKELGVAGLLPTGADTDNPNWSYLHPGPQRNAIALDLSGLDTTTASRVRAGIKLRGLMPMMWDTEERISSLFDPFTGKWSLRNGGVEFFGVSVGNSFVGDVSILGVPRILGLQSLISVHRNVVPLATSSVWQLVVCSAKDFDVRAEYNTSSGRFQPTTAGYYDVIAQAQAEGPAAGSRLYVGVFKNGAVYKAGTVTLEGTAATAHCKAKVFLNGTTDYIDMRVQNTSGAGSLSGEPTATFLQVSKIA